MTERRGGSGNGESGQGAASSAGQPTTSEWAIGFVSTAVVLLLLGYLAWHALFQAPRPPMVHVRVRKVEPMPDGGFVAAVVARNDGTVTAANVEIEGTLKRDTATVEESHATFGFVPGQSSTEGGLFFRHDPRRYHLQLRALGYERP